MGIEFVDGTARRTVPVAGVAFFQTAVDAGRSLHDVDDRAEGDVLRPFGQQIAAGRAAVGIQNAAPLQGLCDRAERAARDAHTVADL